MRTSWLGVLQRRMGGRHGWREGRQICKCDKVTTSGTALLKNLYYSAGTGELLQDFTQKRDRVRVSL